MIKNPNGIYSSDLCWCQVCRGTLHQDYNWFSQIILFICVLGIFCGLLAIMRYSLEKNEQAQCIKWASYAENYPEFYYSNAQKLQCNIK